MAWLYSGSVLSTLFITLIVRPQFNSSCTGAAVKSELISICRLASLTLAHEAHPLQAMIKD